MTKQQARIRALRTADPAVDDANARYDAAVASLLRASGRREFDRLIGEAVIAANVALIQNARRMGARLMPSDRAGSK